jgi:dolichol-phosphate mannosyltransferase
MLRSFCVIIPMFNEESGAEVCVRTVCPALAAIPYPSKLITVNDGSRDRTGAILAALAPEFPRLLVVHHARNAGYGAALRTGIQKAAECSFDYALFMDSDLTNDPADIPKFVALMEQGIDVIKASRFVTGGRMQGVPWRRSIFSRTGNVVARLLFRNGVRDCTNGFRAVKVAILERMDLQERSFPIIVEELYQAKSLARTYGEVPVVLTSRANDQRPTSFSYTPKTFRKYLGFALKAFFGIKPHLKQETPS